MERLEKFRKNYDEGAQLKESRFEGHMDKHQMDHGTIKSILKNPDNILYNKNNNHLLFHKDGDLVVVSGKDSGIISAYGKSSIEGIPKTLEQITVKSANIILQ